METRECHRCHVERPLDMFYLDTESRGRGRRPCRICIREKNAANYAEQRAHVAAIKLASGCVDCGIKSEWPQIYDFDHRPGETKGATIALLIRTSTIAAIDAEIAKCDIVCANCHRIRTAQRTPVHYRGSQDA